MTCCSSHLTTFTVQEITFNDSYVPEPEPEYNDVEETPKENPDADESTEPLVSDDPELD